MGQRNFKPRHRSAPGRTFDGEKSFNNMYDHEWEKYRAKYLSINPRCYSCGVMATRVDHLIPHRGDEKLFRKTDNHIPLCEACHNKVTALFDKKQRSTSSTQNKVKWFAANRAERELTFLVKVLPAYP